MAVEDPAQVAQLATATRIASALGILGSLLTLLFYRLSARFAIPMARLISYLAWAYLVGAVCTLLGPTVAREPFSASCKLTGLLLQLSDLFDVVFMFYIGVGLMLVTFLGWKPAGVRQLDRVFLLGGSVMTLIVGLPWLWILPEDGLRPVYFSMTTWCWVSKSYPYVQAGILYLPMLLVLLFDTAAFVIVGIRIWTKSREHYAQYEKVKDAVHMYILSSLAYLLLFSFCWIPTTISLIIHFAHGESTFGQTMLRSALFPVRGMVNFVLYVILAGMAGQLKPNWAPSPGKSV